MTLEHPFSSALPNVSVFVRSPKGSSTASSKTAITAITAIN